MPTNEETTFAQLGMAALLPGMQHMLTLMQEELDRMRVYLAAGARIEAAPGLAITEITGRPALTYWTRSLEPPQPAVPKRRGRLPAQRIEAEAPPVKLHPRDPRHPEHEAWLQTMKTSQQKVWERMTPAQRKKRVNKMLAARATAQAMRA